MVTQPMLRDDAPTTAQHGRDGCTLDCMPFSVQTVRRVNRALEEALASGCTPWTALGLHWTPTLDPGIVQHLFQEDLELSGAGLVLGSLHSSAVSQVVDTAVGQVRSKNKKKPSPPSFLGMTIPAP